MKTITAVEKFKTSGGEKSLGNLSHLLKQTLELLYQPGEVVEVRILGAPRARVIAGYFNDPKRLCAAITPYDGKVNIYTVLNPVHPGLLARAANRLITNPDATTTDNDVIRRRWFLIDIDPSRPAGVSATDEEKKSAKQRMVEVSRWLGELGWPAPVVADSGNGFYLLYRVDLPNDAESKELISNCLRALSLKFGDEKVAIDTSVFNAARLVRLIGTVNVKGDNIPERPHRRSCFLTVPERIDITPLEKLQELAALVPRPQTEPRLTVQMGGMFDLQDFITRHGLRVSKTKAWQDGTLYELETCPFNPEHKRTARIIEFQNGALAFGCFHNSCSGNDWQALRRLLEPGSKEVISPRSRHTNRSSKENSSRPEGESKTKPSQADVLVHLGLKATLFHDEEHEPFAAFPVGDHQEIWPIRSRRFKRWLTGQFFEITGKAPNTDSINQALNVLEANAVFGGLKYKLHLRTAEHKGAFWYDLGDSEWRVVRITTEGWEVVKRPPILFRRYQNTGEQVMPERGGDLRELLDMVNVRTENEQILLLVYVVAAIVPEIPKPILDVYGEKGAGKTTLLKILRALIDPAIEPLLVIRSDERELAIQLAHNYAPFFDNISGVTGTQGDMLCRAATGAGLTVRALYTDDEERIFRFKRAVGVNGIHLLAGGTDLQDRFLTIELERIENTKRRQEQDLLRHFEEIRPRLFGSMLDALSAAMRIKPTLSFGELPRMADFAAWGAAVAEALDVGAETFLRAYWQNIGAVSERILLSHPVAAAIIALLEETPEWEGTPAELLECLEKMAEKEKINTRSKAWPKSANSLSRRLKEITSNLSDSGIILETGRDSSAHRRRYVRLQRVAKISSESSASVNSLKNLAFSSDDTLDDTKCLPSEIVRKPSEEKARRDADLDDLDGSDDIFPLPLGKENSTDDEIVYGEV
ncbi:hypothetical protein [Thermodesulforhabdus norvegica]|uniref:Uncharacterized protein n=1 Tax=Thermodesulforhabdus norvegica TaxID=39841 RepID=A0A1I4VKM2_9BACT|nr:hypothetical protein [Thermodesulforhabdus norvegica]SFN01699.1 hypothetical protein SAMN05660836_02337 [Thermodesulforhabdus norvegica]